MGSTSQVTQAAPYGETQVEVGGQGGDTPPTRSSSSELSGGGLFFDYAMKTALGLVAFIVPLFYFLSSDTIGLPKHLLLTFLAFVVLLAWVGKIIATGSLSWRQSRLIWPALALGLSAGAGTLTAIAPWVSFFGDTGRYAFSTLSIIAYLIIFLAALENVTRKEALWLAAAAVGSSAVAIGISFLQFAGAHILPGAYTETALFTPLGSLFALVLFSAFSLPIVIDLVGQATIIYRS